MASIEELMRYETAGDPITGLKWTRRTTQKISDQLENLSIQVSANTVARLLKELGFSLRVNHKKTPFGFTGQSRRAVCLHRRASRALRFSGSADRQRRYQEKGARGQLQERRPRPGIDSRWRSRTTTFAPSQDGIAIPYGVYDLQANSASVFVGTSHDTPQFAVENLAKWWRYRGQRRYPAAKSLLILADGGGSNGSRTRAWKHALQSCVCDRYGLEVTVCHYPTGASKWNPIEHRLFSEISKNWAAKPLDSYETILNYSQVHHHLNRSRGQGLPRAKDLPERNQDLRPADG